MRTSTGRAERFDVVVGADGAGSLVRRTFLAPVPKERLTMAAGWFAPGTRARCWSASPPASQGYLWLFPRPDHVGVGICAPLARGADPRPPGPPRVGGGALVSGPPASRTGGATPTPSRRPPRIPRSILEIAGHGGPSSATPAALADPITGEGIYYALRSALVLAETLRDDASPARYPERALEDFGHELLKAAALRDRFYAPGFARRMIDFAARSPAVRAILADLVLGEQGYGGLKRRLLRIGPRFVGQWSLSRLLPHSLR